MPRQDKFFFSRKSTEVGRDLKKGNFRLRIFSRNICFYTVILDILTSVARMIKGRNVSQRLTYDDWKIFLLHVVYGRIRSLKEIRWNSRLLYMTVR